jgi:hypothetical protein
MRYDRSWPIAPGRARLVLSDAIFMVADAIGTGKLKSSKCVLQIGTYLRLPSG